MTPLNLHTYSPTEAEIKVDRHLMTSPEKVEAIESKMLAMPQVECSVAQTVQAFFVGRIE